jgi:uncharacterized membrane protein SpoIIM required for sporulation
MSRGPGVAAFVRARREGWERLDRLVDRVGSGRLPLAEVEELDRRYRRAAGDLAHARAAFAGSDAEGYLAQLTAKAWGALHLRRRRPLAGLLAVLRVDGPRTLVAHRGELALSAGLFLFGLALGGAAMALEPAAAGWMIPAPVEQALRQKRLWTDDLLTAAPGFSGGAIARNNVTVAALCLALGLTGGVGTALLLLGNGLLLGAVLVAAWQAGLGGGLLGFVAAHGPVELSALVLAGQAGFILARGLVRPGEWPRGVALAARGREAARLMVLVVPLLVLVAAIEATVSPAGRFPAAAKAALGISLAAGAWSYLWRAGRSATRASGTTAGERASPG